MLNLIPADVGRRMERLKQERFQSDEDVLRAAISALERDEEDYAAIKAGIADLEAGRIKSLEEVDAEFRRKHGIASE